MAPKIVIKSPLKDYPNRYRDTNVPIDVYVYDKDNLSEVNVTVVGSGQQIYVNNSGSINQAEYKLAVWFKLDTMYGQDPLNCIMTVEATDSKGTQSKQSVSFPVYNF